MEKVKKPRGRPRKAKSEETVVEADSETPVPKKRGRPPKKDTEDKSSVKAKAAPKKKAAAKEDAPKKKVKTTTKAKAKSEPKSKDSEGLKVTVKETKTIKRKYEAFRKRFELTDDQFNNLNEQDISDLRAI